MIGAKSSNNLGETSVQYSPFYANGVSGVASSELVVSQNFDFPTLYVARNKANKIKCEELGLQYNLAKRDVLFAARTICLDIIHLRKQQMLLDKRTAIADSLTHLFQTKYDKGETTVIELNKVKMERMELTAENEELQAALKTAQTQLTAMNGNQPIDFNCTEYPELPLLPDDAALAEQYLADNKEILAAEAQAKATQQNISVSKQNSLPKLTLGYRRNTNLDDAVNGFLVGASIPLFSNRHKTQEAKAMHENQMQQLEDTRIQNASAAQSIIAELRHTELGMKAYDTNLMESTLHLLGKAVTAGEISAIDYFREADAIKVSMTKYLELENTYHKTISRIFKNKM
jgi:outer membrane protein TolC